MKEKKLRERKKKKKKNGRKKNTSSIRDSCSNCQPCIWHLSSYFPSLKKIKLKLF